MLYLFYKGDRYMKNTYHVRSLNNNGVPFRAVFRSLEMAVLKKKLLEQAGEKVGLYRNDPYGNTKRIG
jgi:hypothetical protein